MLEAMECLNYGTQKCETCREKGYCDKRHQKLENGTFNLLDDYWDYIDEIDLDELGLDFD